MHFKRMCILLSLSLPYCYSFSIQLFCQLSKVGYWNLYRIVQFFFQFCQFFLHIFGDSVVRYIYTLIVSSGCIDTFIIMTYLFVASIFLVLKSICLTLIQVFQLSYGYCLHGKYFSLFFTVLPFFIFELCFIANVRISAFSLND